MARRHVRRGKKYLGNRSYGVGNIKNNRGKGSKGGKGLAGLGKHKWMQTIKSGKLDEIKARHKGFSNPAKRTLKNVSKAVSLARITSDVRRGKYSLTPEGVAVVELPRGYKVLGSGVVDCKLEVTADSFAAKAKEKIVAAGGAVNARK